MGCAASTTPPATTEPGTTLPKLDATTAKPAAADPATTNPKLDVTAKEPPTVWVASSGCDSEELQTALVKTLLKRRQVFDAADESMALKDVADKYKDTIATFKQVHIMDALFYRDYDTIRKWKDGEEIYCWDFGLVKYCGFKPENVTTVMLNMKPWLFKHAGEPGMWSPQEPEFTATSEEEADYMAKLQQTRDAYAALKCKPPQAVPVLASGKSCADELAEASQGLNKKYPEALASWVEKVLGGADVVTCQGGDVVNLNMTFQCNQLLARQLIHLVHENKTMYAGHSAGAMVMAKSMEMTKEIGPGWLEAFACSKEFLHSDGVMFNDKDLDGDGVTTNVLGALPMFQTSFAMRPHYSKAWAKEVMEKNKAAELEFEQETGQEIEDSITDASTDDAESALKLLNIVGQNAKDQDAPVFLPLQNGRCIVAQFMNGKEVFKAIGTASTKHVSTAG